MANGLFQWRTEPLNNAHWWQMHLEHDEQKTLSFSRWMSHLQIKWMFSWIFVEHKAYLSFSSRFCLLISFTFKLSNWLVTSSAHRQFTKSWRRSVARQCGHCCRWSVSHLYWIGNNHSIWKICISSRMFLLEYMDNSIVLSNVDKDEHHVIFPYKWNNEKLRPMTRKKYFWVDEDISMMRHTSTLAVPLLDDDMFIVKSIE